MDDNKMAVDYGTAYQAIKYIYQKAETLSQERNQAMEQLPHFPQGYIFDEDKSVRWNHEECERRKADRRKILSEYGERERILWNSAEKTIKTFIMQEFDLSPKIADAVYSVAQERGHASGYYEILSEANALGEFAQKILQLKEEEEEK